MAHPIPVHVEVTPPPGMWHQLLASDLCHQEILRSNRLELDHKWLRPPSYASVSFNSFEMVCTSKVSCAHEGTVSHGGLMFPSPASFVLTCHMRKFLLHKEVFTSNEVHKETVGHHKDLNKFFVASFAFVE